MEIKQLSLEEWKPIAKDAHLVVFNEIKEEEVNTFDFALMVTENNEPICYSTCIELDKYCCYMQHGGAFPRARGTVLTAKGYVVMIRWLKKKYPRLTTKVKNDNIAMLKLSLGVGFVVNGMDVFGNELYLRLVNDKEIN